MSEEIQLSKEDWDKISAGMSLSPNDLSMITAGLELLMKAQQQLATLAKEEPRQDNLTECLEAEAHKTEALLVRVIEHQAACALKALELQED
jgi:hypothetical protein